MNVPCTYQNATVSKNIKRTDLLNLANQSDAALEQFSDLRAVINDLAPGITQNGLASALRLYNAAVQEIRNAGVSEEDEIHRLIGGITIGMDERLDDGEARSDAGEGRSDSKEGDEMEED
jgi:hypothetical protein